MAFTTIADYTSDGSTTTFTVPFPYIAKDDVEVYVAGVLQAVTSNYTWPTTTQVRLNSAAPLGASVRIKRNTPKADPKVVFSSGSVLTSADLNTIINQLLYIEQELVDYTAEVLSSATATAASQGNVPTPLNPSDDNKVLRSLSGTYGWTKDLSLNDGTFVDLTSQTVNTGTLTTSGPINATGPANVSGLVCSGMLLSDTIRVTGNSLDIHAKHDTDAQYISFTKSVTSTTYPSFTVWHSGTTLVFHAGNSVTQTDLLTLSKSASTDGVIVGAHFSPATNASLDLGLSATKFRDLFLSGAVRHTPIGFIAVAASVTLASTTGSSVIPTAVGFLDNPPSGFSAHEGGGGLFTIRRSGWYSVSVSASHVSQTAGIRTLFLNGMPAGYSCVASSNVTAPSVGAQVNMHASTVCYLAAGTQFTLSLQQSFSTSTIYSNITMSAIMIGE